MSEPGGKREKGAGPAPSLGSESSFLKRWSERKRGAADGASAESGISSAGSAAEPGGPADAVATEPVLTDADMPPVEALGEDSEYGGFLSPGVSEELRRLALRKLFHLPSFNVRDGLDDYDEDFTRFAALGNVMTQDLRHRLETAARRRAESEEPRAADEEAGAAGPEDATSEPEFQQTAAAERPAEADSSAGGGTGPEGGERG